MLHLVLGPDHKVNTKHVMERMLQQVKSGKSGQFLIVPEQFSFEAERSLCRMGGNSVSRYAEVLSLTRLANRVESVYGGTASLWLDNGGRLLAAAQAVEQVSSRLKLFASVCRKPEFLESFLAFADEIGGYGITSDTLSNLSQTFSGQFSLKLQELALLYESYLAVCSDAKDPIARLQNLRDVLREEPFAQGKDFYVCQFFDFTALEREILEELILSADSLTVSLPDEYVGQSQVFSSSEATAADLRTFCQRHGVPVKSVQLDFEDSVHEDLLHLQQSIAQHTPQPYLGSAERVRFTRFDSVESECRYAAKVIRELVNGGARYRQIALACSDFQAYGPVLARVLDLAEIPHFSSNKESVLSVAGTKMLLYALRAVAAELDRESVMDFLKTGATALSPDQCDRLENYAILWNVSGQKWQQPWPWHPAGIGYDWNEQHESFLQQLNAWRSVAVKDLVLLRDRMQKAKTVADMAEAAYQFLVDINFAERLQHYVDILFERGEYQRSQQYAQVHDVLVNALQQICAMMPRAVRTAEEFCSLFEKLLGQYGIGSVPSTVDQVLVGELSSFRMKPVDHLLVLGANEGSLPACSHGNGMFTEEERMQMLAAGVDMAPLRADAVDRELAGIYSTLRSARQSVTVSCSAEPSYLMTKASVLFGGFGEGPGETIVLNPGELAAACLRNGEEGCDPAVREAMRLLQEKRSYSFGQLQMPQVEGLYGKNFSLSASKIDKIAMCRFAYFLRYGLRAEERKEADFDASAFGTFVHAVLEKTVESVMEKGGFHAVSAADLESMAQQAMAEYVEENLNDLAEKDPRFLYRISRNKDEAMAVVRDLGEELRSSDFEPAANELKFADDGPMPSVRIQGEHAVGTLSGFVDRVDLYRKAEHTFVRVVDYKTGHKEFDYTELSVGAGMQMLIYLFALKEHGAEAFGTDLHPAGVLYHPAREDILPQSARVSQEEARLQHQKARCRKGLVTDNEAILKAMEHFESTPKYLPIHITKNGYSGDMVTGEQMELLEKHVFRMLGKLADDIHSGCVTPNPVIRDAASSACSYCEYQDLCHKDLALHDERHLKKVTGKQFFAELEKEAQHGKN